MAEKSAEVMPELVLKRGANGRCTYNVVAKRALAQRCKQPGVSVARLALTHGVNANLLRKWMNALDEGKVQVAEPAPTKIAGALLLPVRTSGTLRTPMSAPSFIEMDLGAARIRVHGTVDACALGIVLDCLAQRA